MQVNFCLHTRLKTTKDVRPVGDSVLMNFRIYKNPNQVQQYKSSYTPKEGEHE